MGPGGAGGDNRVCKPFANSLRRPGECRALVSDPARPDRGIGVYGVSDRGLWVGAYRDRHRALWVVSTQVPMGNRMDPYDRVL